MKKVKLAIILVIIFTVTFLTIFLNSNTTVRGFYSLEYGLPEEDIYRLMGENYQSKTLDSFKEISYIIYRYRPKDSFPFYEKIIDKEYTVFVKNGIVIKRSTGNGYNERTTYHWGL